MQQTRRKNSLGESAHRQEAGPKCPTSEEGSVPREVLGQLYRPDWLSCREPERAETPSARCYHEVAAKHEFLPYLDSVPNVATEEPYAMYRGSISAANIAFWTVSVPQPQISVWFESKLLPPIFGHRVGTTLQQIEDTADFPT